MAGDPFYVTTPIYYANAEPTIGHAYTTVLGDVLARYHRLFGDDTYYLTGADEHGLKVQQAADARGVAPQRHADEMSARFKALFQRLEITNDDFIRTTEPRHKRVVQEFLQRSHDNGDIYKGTYKGFYSVREEMFVTESEKDGLKDDVAAGRVIELEEENYFFRLSKYQQWLIDYLNANPDFIAPDTRRNEVLGFLREPLNDLCVSRPATRLKWGIPLPFDDKFVTYVWFDALINYVSALGWDTSNTALFKKYWPSALHLIGKDILKPHCVYWPMMLKSAGLTPPRQILAHGWWCAPDGSKLSKSIHGSGLFLWLADQYGVEEFRYFVMRGRAVALDGGVDERTFVDRITSDLSNDLGNLLSRTVKMVQQYCGGVVPERRSCDGTDEGLEAIAGRACKRVRDSIEQIEPHNAIEEIMSLVRATNRYIVAREPWALHKQDKREPLEATLYHCLEILRLAGVALSPVMPAKCAELLRQIGAPAGEGTWEQAMTWGGLEPGAVVPGGEPLFPRIAALKGQPGAAPSEIGKGEKSVEGIAQQPAEKPAKAEGKAAGRPKAPGGAVAPGGAGAQEGLVTIDEFFKAQLRTAEIVEAKRHPNADRLLVLQIALGEERRQIVVGIAAYFKPEELIGKRIAVVANLVPAKLRGEVSQGMLLAAKDGAGRLTLLTTSDPAFPSGCEIS